VQTGLGRVRAVALGGPTVEIAGVSDQVPTPPERPQPRGCNPLVFGVVMATIQLAITLYFMGSC
jgi:hypothetical protein